MLNLIVALFIISTSWAGINCPPETLSIEHRSPVTGIKKVTCGYLKDGSLIKHGPETEFNSDDSVKRVVYFNQNVEGEKPASAPDSVTKNLPGADETSESFAVLENLLRVLSFNRSGVNAGEFRVGKCDPKSSTWVKGALTKTDIQKSYSFNDRCDVAGSFTASFAKEFPINFQLRNLRGFTSTIMFVRMSLRPEKGGLRYRFEVSNGIVSSSDKKISFKAHYEVSLNPMTGATLPSTQDGKVTIVKVGDKVVDITRPLIFAH